MRTIIAAGVAACGATAAILSGGAAQASGTHPAAPQESGASQESAGTTWRWYGEYNTQAGCEHTGQTLVAQRKALAYNCYWEPVEWDLEIKVWA